MADLEDDKGVPLWVRLCTPATRVWQGPATDGAPPHGAARRLAGGTERVIDVLGRLYGATMVRYGESWLNSDGPDYTRVGERLVVEQGWSVASIYDIGPRPMAEAQRANSETGPSPFRPRTATIELVKKRLSMNNTAHWRVGTIEAAQAIEVLCEQVDELWRVLDGADEEAG